MMTEEVKMRMVMMTSPWDPCPSNKSRITKLQRPRNGGIKKLPRSEKDNKKLKRR